jgi:hypothetical protein
MTTTTLWMRDLEARYRQASGLRDRLYYTVFYSQVRPAPLLILGWKPRRRSE